MSETNRYHTEFAKLEQVNQGPLGWQNRARCAGNRDVSFYPERGERTEPAKAICRLCVVQEDCLEYALSKDEQHGIWGASSTEQRNALKKESEIAAALERHRAANTAAQLVLPEPTPSVMSA